VQEVVLTGVNIGDYGKGLAEKHDFLDVIQALDEVEGIKRFRISSIEPNLLSNEIIAFVAKSRRFMPHFHVPLQSGNNEMLGQMRRRYKRELYADRVTTIKSLMPHACIGVDVIVGFPGETEAHFLDTYQFLQELPIAYLHVFTYSERENTLAASMGEAVPMKERHRRNQMLRILSEKKRSHFYEGFIGERRTVLFEGKEEGEQRFGFTENYLKVRLTDPSVRPNELHTVQLRGVSPEGWVDALLLPERVQ
jgi:threonylcarbamoyladenosine tRNA methylthiotransferase MtaB